MLTTRTATTWTKTLLLGLGLLLAGAAWADAPGRVGRLGDTQGTVWLYDTDAGEWVAAQRNRPLTSGDRIATDQGARADCHAAHDDRPTADRGAATDAGGDDDPIRFSLWLATRRRRARVQVVDEHNPVADEDLVFDVDAFADERVR